MQEDIVEPVVQQSLLTWYYSSLGLKYAALLPLTGLFSFVATVLLLIRGRGPFVSSGLIFAVAAPVFLGLMGTVEGISYVYQVIAMSSAQPRPSELGEGISTALATLQVGIAFAVPSFLLAAIGALVRAMTASEPSSVHELMTMTPSGNAPSSRPK